MLDYIRIGCAVPSVKVADVIKNTEDICTFIKKADDKNCDLVVFPEMALTGYSCGDLFFQESLLHASRKGISEITAFSATYPQLTAVVGAPLVLGGQMYNCGVVIAAGKVQGIVPKTYLPNYREFYERRWFSSSEDLHQETVNVKELGIEGDYTVPVGRNILFRVGEGALFGVEICEDLWTPMPPSTLMTLNGAEVILNLSASNETVGKRDYRRNLVQHQSAICSCIYAYTSSGCTESTQDLVFSGHSIIAQNGSILEENKKILDTDYLMVTDCDLGKVRAERRKNKSVRDAASIYGGITPMRIAAWGMDQLRSDGMLAKLHQLPFVPDGEENWRERCMSIFQIQAAGLAHRLETIGANAVIGVSGGLDSTLALLVAVEAMRRLGRPASDVYGITMPCFGTSGRTHKNSLMLMEKLGITSKEINIRDAVSLHFRDIGHDPAVLNGTFENSQARERTQVLMDYAGMVNGIVVGTGDLSELALGWCTYNGDHMSMYSVNASIPKTLIGWMIRAIAESPDFCCAAEVLLDVVDTPISPELLPADEKGNISQQTEDLVGPYPLHDFFLYYMLRYDFSPKKIYALACRAFKGTYSQEIIKKWIQVFYRRFFTQQFKRSCMPDGVKIGSISVSPRGDWRMPSDASGRIWLEEVKSL